MISYLIDPQYASRLCEENNIWPDLRMGPRKEKIDVSTLKLEKDFAATLELKLSVIRRRAKEIHLGTNLLTKAEVFKVLTLAGVLV